MRKKYRSEALAAVHESMEGLHEIGLVDKQTMRTFDHTCLTPVDPLTASQIRNIRQKEKVSQALFAHYMNTTVTLISQWERGEKKPSGPALKLLTLVKNRGLRTIA